MFTVVRYECPVELAVTMCNVDEFYRKLVGNLNIVPL